MTYAGTNDIFAPTAAEAVVWRYMDFTKFVWMLDREALFFARADLLGDPFEGSFPRRHAELRPEWEREQGYPPGSFDDLAYARRFAPQQMFVSAWHANEVESAAMWNLYLRSSEGIAVRSTFQRLTDSLREERPVFGGGVTYVDYETAVIPEGNMFWPFAHKRQSFEHEREVRLAIAEFHYYERLRARTTPELRARALATAGAEDSPDLDLDDVLPLPPAGLQVPVDMGSLIDRVYVAPTAAPWFKDLVESTMKRFGRDELVHQSSLANDPTY